MHYNSNFSTIASALQKYCHCNRIFTTTVSSPQHRHRNIIGTILFITTVSSLPQYRQYNNSIITTTLLSLQQGRHHNSIITTIVLSPEQDFRYSSVYTIAISSLQQYPHYNSILTTIVSSTTVVSLKQNRHCNTIFITKVSAHVHGLHIRWHEHGLKRISLPAVWAFIERQINCISYR